MMAEQGGFTKLISLIGAGARISVKPLLVVLIGCSFITLMAVVYARWAMDVSWGYPEYSSR